MPVGREVVVGLDNVTGAFNSFLDVEIWDARNRNPNANSAIINSITRKVMGSLRIIVWKYAMAQSPRCRRPAEA